MNPPRIIPALGAAIALSATATFVAAAFAAAPVNAQQAVRPNATTTCSTSGACVAGANNSTGQGVSGTSKLGTGIYGATSFHSTSTHGESGIFGIDLSSSGASNIGIFGVSTNGVGVRGTSNKSAGVLGQSINNLGISGTSGSGNGVQGVTGFFNNQGVGSAGVAGFDNSRSNFSNKGVYGGSTFGTGVQGRSEKTYGVFGITLGSGFGAVEGQAFASSGIEFEGIDGAGTPNFRVDTAGNIRITGLLYSGGSCSTGCYPAQHSQPGRQLVSYAPREAEVTMEDTGEAQLIAGRTVVPLDPRFANGINTRAHYSVFITPEGNSHGLYVTEQSARGFTVRENDNGRSTLAFNYRIVAKPYGVSAARLPMVDSKALPDVNSKPPRFVAPRSSQTLR